MTTTQALETLEEQEVDMHKWTEAGEQAKTDLEYARAELARIAKEVGGG
jgi:hypothetical protein